MSFTGLRVHGREVFPAGWAVVLRRLAGPALIALAVVALAGCGSSSSPTTNQPTNGTSEAATTGTTPATTGTTPATTGTTPATTPAEDKRIAADAQLKLTDFPSGWQQKASTTESEDEVKCEGFDAPRAEASAQAESPTFSKETTSVTSSALIYPDTPSARQAFGQISSEAVRRCLADEVAKALESAKDEAGVEVGKITSGRISIGPVGDERAASRFAIPFNLHGLRLQVVIELVFARTGRAVAYLGFADLSPDSFDEALRDRLTTTVVDRLKSGLGQSS